MLMKMRARQLFSVSKHKSSHVAKRERWKKKNRPRAIWVAERFFVAISGDTPNTHSLLTNIPASGSLIHALLSEYSNV